MPFDILLFDLDGTLYDHACGYEASVHQNIFRFMVETTGGKFDAITTIDEAKLAWQPIFDEYNLTKRGLLGESYVFDGRYYDQFIRQGAEKFIAKDPELRKFFVALPLESRKVIFTNAPESSAHEILKLLGVDDLIDDVLGTDFLDNQICKPERAAFDKVLEYLDAKDRPDRICYFEDSYKNLLVGKELGFKTVFVSCATLSNEGRSKDELEVFDAVVEGKVGMDLKRSLPEIFIPSSTAIEVLAFDLDGTLYDRANGYMSTLRSNILNFMVEASGGKFDEIHTLEDAEVIWRPIFHKYHNTKRGLLASGFEFDSKSYDEAIRKGESEYFEPDDELRELLTSLKQRKIIFTNAPESSARKILDMLGIAGLFECVLGTDFFENRTCKPELESFEKLFVELGLDLSTSATLKTPL